VACESDVVARYTPGQDDGAMAAIASAWSEPGGLSISLCEDVERSATWTGPDECVVDHVVRGGGLGMDHTVKRETGGCAADGCPYRVEAWVVGTISGPGLTGDVPVAGAVELQSSLDDDPYAYPYRLRLTCDATVQECSVTGTLDADGDVTATLVLGPSGPGQVETQHSLARVGDAACP
jgi:hypothetical protein